MSAFVSTYPTARERHAYNRCPGKSPGHRIEREFVKNMTAREYS